MATLISENHRFDSPTIKIIFLAILGIISIYSFGHYLSLTFNSTIESRMMMFAFIAAAFYLIFFFFQAIFVRSTWEGNLIILLEAITFALAFRNHLSKPILLAFVLFFLVLMVGRFSVKREIENHLRLSFLRVNRLAFSYAVTAMSIFLAIFVGVLFMSSSIGLEKILSPITNLTAKMLPGSNSSNLSTNLISSMVRQQLDQDPKFKDLSETQKNLVITQALGEFEKQMGMSSAKDNKSASTGESSLIGGLFKGLNDFFANMDERTKMLVAIIIAILVFGIIKAVLAIFSWPVTFIAFLLYELLLATNFAKISLEQKEKEVLNL
ncbi:MAG: hypothetical protein WC297_01060 [Candidatus Paceibacterota bacterium]|jgi:hypothetical protein